MAHQCPAWEAWRCPQANRAVESEATGPGAREVTSGQVPYFAKLDLSTLSVLRIDSASISLAELFGASPDIAHLTDWGVGHFFS